MAAATTTAQPDFSNLSPKMQALLDLLEETWAESDEQEAECLAWFHCSETSTIAALIRRGFPILCRRSYYGQEIRLADPHSSGLGF